MAAAEAVQASLEAPASGAADEPQPQPQPQPQPAPGEPQPAPGEPQPQPDPDSTIMERLQLILRVNLTAEDLLKQTQPAQALLQAGRVFAVQQVDGQPRHARVSLEAGDVYLHTLKEQLPPDDVATLQMSEVMPPSPPCTVFLDLSWPGVSPRRVQIRLSPDTPRGRQFLMLCTGQRGQSYANTKLFGKKDEGKPGERVWGGDYERNDGKGSCLLLPGLDEGEYTRSGQAGAVFGRKWGDSSECGHFIISTRDCKEGVEWQCVFGEVMDGLNVVAEAAQYSSIKEVIVVDCGVVL